MQGAPRCEERLSRIQKARRASRYGGWVMTWATRRSKGAIPVVASQRGGAGRGARRAPRGKPRRPPRVLVIHPGYPPRARGRGGMPAEPGLDAGFLVGADHEVLHVEGLALPLAGVWIEDPPGLRLEHGVAGKIHARCCQGRMASSWNHRHTVVLLRVATEPPRWASRTISV